MFSTLTDEKTAEGVRILESVDGPGLFLFVAHPGLNVPELAAMTDLNTTGPTDMAVHRQAETDMLTSPDWRDAIERRGIVLTSYAELRDQGLSKMQRPWLAEPYKGPAAIREAWKKRKAEQDD